MKAKAVIFDMDGVLIDTEKYLVKYWCQAAQEAGFDMRYEHALLLRSLAGRFAEPKMKELFGEQFDYMAVRERRKELMHSQLEEHGIEIKPQADELLFFLRQKGYKTAVATATDEERTRRYLKEVKILDYFNEIICAPMVERGKPCPDIYVYACGRLSEQPGDCIALEDSPNGVTAAYRAGCKVIMVPDLTEPDEKLQPMLSGVAHGLAEVKDWL